MVDKISFNLLLALRYPKLSSRRNFRWALYFFKD